MGMTAATAGTVASIASVAMAGFSAFSQLQGGQMANAAAKNEAQQSELQREIEKTRAMQEEANRKARLNEILNNQMAMTAGRGVAVGSGSDIALTDFSIEEAERESGIAALDSKFRQQQLTMRAGQSRLSGRASLLSSRSQAGSTLFEAATRAADRIST
jgi:hypothetical protein